jgi:SulP family sulfate permease
LQSKNLIRDAVAGVTVAIVALPLALGFGITSGMSAATGLTTAIIAGFIAAILGGSRFQVSGPTGAMTVVLIPIIHSYGIQAIPLLGLMAGVIVIALALLKTGPFINRIPWPVVEGFTVGIAAVIALQQIPLALGVAKHAGDRSIPIAIGTITDALNSGIQWQTLALVGLTLVIKFTFPWVWRKTGLKFHVPASAVAILVVTLTLHIFAIKSATIGEIPRSIGTWNGHLLDFTLIPNLIIPAAMIAALCAIESLLSARVADSMAHVPVTEHFNTNKELFGQGAATVVASLFGGMPATGAIARTSVNVRAHAHSKYASAFHAVVLLVVALVAAPLVSSIPSAAIAGVLIGTSYRILNPASIMESLRTTKDDAAVLVVTAISTLAIDLIWGIGIGIALFLALNYRKRNLKNASI